MANGEKGEVDVAVDGKTYTLRLNANALCELETLLSSREERVTFQQVVSWCAAGQLLAVRALLWAALRAYHPGVTLQDAGELMTRIDGLAPKLLEALAASMPKPNGAIARPQTARRVGRGKRSTSEPGASA